MFCRYRQELAGAKKMLSDTLCWNLLLGFGKATIYLKELLILYYFAEALALKPPASEKYTCSCLTKWLAFVYKCMDKLLYIKLQNQHTKPGTYSRITVTLVPLQNHFKCSSKHPLQECLCFFPNT